MGQQGDEPETANKSKRELKSWKVEKWKRKQCNKLRKPQSNLRQRQRRKQEQKPQLLHLLLTFALGASRLNGGSHFTWWPKWEQLKEAGKLKKGKRKLGGGRRKLERRIDWKPKVGHEIYIQVRSTGFSWTLVSWIVSRLACRYAFSTQLNSASFERTEHAYNRLRTALGSFGAAYYWIESRLSSSLDGDRKVVVRRGWGRIFAT